MDPDIENTELSTAESFAPEVSNEPEAPKINPAWEEALSQIPEEFHPALTPKLNEWDQNFQKVQQTYAPYKELVDAEIPFEQVQRALQINDLINSNPRGVYDFLQTQYNYGASSVTGPQENNAEDEFVYDADENDISKHPLVQELSQKVSSFENYFQTQQQRELENRVQQEIEGTFNQISGKYGELDTQTKQDIARLAMGAGDNDLSKAADDYFTRFRQPARASDTAPPVLRGNGRVASGIQLSDLANMDSDERVKHLAAMMEAQGRNS